MSVADAGRWLRERTSSEAVLRERATAVLFGDRIGLAIFLGCLCLFAVFWRTNVLINDTYALANGLYSLSQGQLAMTEAAYGPTLETPGVGQSGGQLFARNYGAIVLSLPYWALLEGASAVVDLRIGVVALWSLALLAFVVTVGRLLDRDRVVLVGGPAVLAIFLANVAVARPLDGAATHLYALQLFHLTVAAFGPVLLYRLVRRSHSRRIGIASAVLYTVGTPLGLWATVPKRHVLTATVVLAVAYCLYRSRTAEREHHARFRALAYALVGLYAWIHAAEALLFMLVLATVDVPTARENSPRTLLVVALAVVLSLVPFFVTNALITGSPVEPPRALLTSAPTSGADGAAGASGSGSGPGAPPGGGATSLLDEVGQLASPLVETLTSLLVPVLWLGEMLETGLGAIGGQPADLYRALIRSGHTAGTVNLENEEAVNLSLLESAPALVATLGAVTAIVQRGADLSLPSRVLPARSVVDLFAVLTVFGTVAMYGDRLPIHAQITVRYWFPLYPLGVYLLVRTPVVRRTLSEHWRAFVWALSASLFVGGQLVVAAVFLTADGTGEAFQFHALLALATVIPLGLWAALGRSDGWFGRFGAVLLGVATAGPTVFVALTAFEYYALGDTHALPAVRWLAELLGLL